MDYAGSEDCDLFSLTRITSVEELGLAMRDLVDTQLGDKGAVLVRGLDKVIRGNTEFSQMVELMGEKFAYTAGMATRKEFDDAPGALMWSRTLSRSLSFVPGVVAASDDPPEVTMEPHLEMSYNREMPGG